MLIRHPFIFSGELPKKKKNAQGILGLQESDSQCFFFFFLKWFRMYANYKKQQCSPDSCGGVGEVEGLRKYFPVSSQGSHHARNVIYSMTPVYMIIKIKINEMSSGRRVPHTPCALAEFNSEYQLNGIVKDSNNISGVFVKFPTSGS